MFKYFFSCPKSELVADGKLVLDRLGEAAAALKDCRIDRQHCTVTEPTANCPLGPGTIIDPHPADGSRAKNFGWKPSYQWLAFESGREGVQALIGYDGAIAFKPELLRRRRIIDGAALRDNLESDRQWLIPTARSPLLAYGQLPTTYAPEVGGGLKQVISKKDLWLWELSGQAQDFLAGEKSEGFTPLWHLETAITILGVNYRLGRPELSVLTELEVNPLNAIFAINCLHALCGFSHWDEWLGEVQKKTPPDTSPAPADSKSGSGEPEACPADSAGES